MSSLNVLFHIKNASHKSDTLHLGLLQIVFDDLVFSLDGLTLNAISDYVRSVTKVMKQASINENVEVHQYYFMDQQERTSIKNGIMSWESMPLEGHLSNYAYVEKLAISPVRIRLTFNNTGISEESFAGSFLKSTLGKTVANIEDASLNMTGLEIKQLYGTRSQLIESSLRRYRDMTKGQLLSIALSSKVLGNPKKFFTRIGSGVTDLLEKPEEGF